MANNNTGNIRGTHVSPGIYTKETDLTYASKSLGITKLGLVGETVKGPAFQPITIENWREFQTYFGGTNTEKYRGSNYPKYELPYIAKSYLQQSDNLQVVRVLGLSGVNAGPAWVITAEGEDEGEGMVVAVLRSRGEHKKASLVTKADDENGLCEDEYEYDKILYYASEVSLMPSTTLSLVTGCDTGWETEDGDFSCDTSNYGTFTIKVTTYDDEIKYYAVSFNSTQKNYIYNVIGGDPEIGDSEIYVEELYDVALQQLIESGKITAINKDIVYYPDVKIIPDYEEVDGILTEDWSMLKRKNVGERYLYSAEESVNEENGDPLEVHYSEDKGKTWTLGNGIAGMIYTVKSMTNSDGTKSYIYAAYISEGLDVGTDGSVTYSSASTVKNYETERLSESSVDENGIYSEAVLNKEDGLYYIYSGEDVVPVTLDFNNYKEGFRYASTPWVLSEIKGSGTNIEVNKLFRFHTISDGDIANTEIKVSIQNIDPDNGTFDVIVRSFYDTDASQTVLERFTKCDLVPGSDNYIALKIGSFDESYESQSNYITVEVNENDKTKVSIPAGFMGYPVRNFEGLAVGSAQTIEGEDSSSDSTSDDSSDSTITLRKPYLQYNTDVDDEIRINKQYFGISDIVGIDEDVFRYKGVQAYNGEPESLTPCFHLDSRIFNGVPNDDGEIYDEDDETLSQVVTIDGETGYSWSTVGKSNVVNNYAEEPRIGTESTMIDTIYEDKRYRKFTVAFYGGWDGWDYYRKYRSNGDDYRYKTYRGNLNTTSGEGYYFNVIKEPERYKFDVADKCITSDYYAYLYGIRQFSNPADIDINIIATPGIDYVNNNALVSEVIEMVEEERADSVYVVTTPDKPLGASDDISEMYTPDDAVYNLDDADIDSNYVCTYYPNVKYYDTDNNMYIYLPPTKDVVRNMAYTDNVAFPWFAPAGWYRGEIDGVKSKCSLTLSDEDTLYENRINFVKNFATDGMRIWGDKNLQVAESQMNRLSKRRLLLRVRKLCSIACIGLIFDPNDATTATAFESAVNPILESIAANRGLTDFRVEVDDSTEARERLELPARLYLKPTPNLEYITMDFVITPQGTDWDDIA